MRDTLSEARETAHRAVREKGVPAMMVAMLLLSVVAGVAAVGAAQTTDGNYIGERVFVGGLSGSTAAVNESTGAVEWNVATHTDTVADAALAPSGDIVFTTGAGSADDVAASYAANGTVKWRVTQGGSVGSISVSPTGDSLYYQLSSSVVESANASNGAEKWITDTGSPIQDITISPDGSTVYAVGSDGTVRAIDASTGSVNYNVTPSAEDYQTVAISPDGSTLFVGTRSGTIKKLNANDATVIADYAVHTDIVTSLAVSNAGDYIISGSYDNTVVKTNTSDGTEIWNTSAAANTVRSVSISADGESVFAGDDDGDLLSLSATDGATEYTSNPGIGRLYALATGYKSSATGGGGATATPVPEEKNLTIDTRALFKPNSTHPYQINFEDVGNVTSEATLTSSNSTLLTVDSTNYTLSSINDSNVSAVVTLNASYVHNNTTYYAEKNVVVAEATVENLAILPGGTWRSSALLGDGFFQALLVAMFIGVAMTRFTSAFGGLAGAQMILTIGWFAGYVSWAMAAVSLFVALFIGLNLAANIDYTVRR